MAIKTASNIISTLLICHNLTQNFDIELIKSAIIRNAASNFKSFINSFT